MEPVESETAKKVDSMPGLPVFTGTASPAMSHCLACCCGACFALLCWHLDARLKNFGAAPPVCNCEHAFRAFFGVSAVKMSSEPFRRRCAF